METNKNPQIDPNLSPVDTETLSQHISAVLDGIHQLLESAPDDQTEEILRKQRSFYLAFLEKLTQHAIDQNTLVYLDAIESLKVASKAAADAKRNINMIADAINKVVDASKALDKFAQLGIKFLT